MYGVENLSVPRLGATSNSSTDSTATWICHLSKCQEVSLVLWSCRDAPLYFNQTSLIICKFIGTLPYLNHVWNSLKKTAQERWQYSLWDVTCGAKNTIYCQSSDTSHQSHPLDTYPKSFVTMHHKMYALIMYHNTTPSCSQRHHFLPSQPANQPLAISHGELLSRNWWFRTSPLSRSRMPHFQSTLSVDQWSWIWKWDAPQQVGYCQK